MSTATLTRPDAGRPARELTVTFPNYPGGATVIQLGSGCCCGARILVLGAVWTPGLVDWTSSLFANVCASSNAQCF